MANAEKTRFEEFRFELGYKLRSIREAKGYSMNEMAEKLNTSNNTVASYESGKETANLLYLYEVAKIGGVTLEDLASLSKKDFLIKVYSMFD
jgi:transcriptional regulator with XRE-family HTH domain